MYDPFAGNFGKLLTGKTQVSLRLGNLFRKASDIGCGLLLARGNLNLLFAHGVDTSLDAMGQDCEWHEQQQRGPELDE